MGQLECLPCDSGYYQSVEGKTECQICPEGTYSGVRASICTKCGGVSAAPLPGTTECKTCPANSQPSNDRRECLCNSGFYSVPMSNSSHLPLILLDNEGALYCAICPGGSDCSKIGTSWRTISTLAGYWRSSNETRTYYRCPVVTYCQGGVDSECDGNRGGPLCALCNPGYMEQSTGACTPCPPTQAGSWVLLFFLLCIVALIIWIAFWIVVRNDRALLNIAVREAVRRVRGVAANIDSNGNGSGNQTKESIGLAIRKGDKLARTRGRSLRADAAPSLPLAYATPDFVGEFNSKSFASVPSYTSTLTRVVTSTGSNDKAPESRSAVDALFSEDNTDNHLTEGVVLGSHRKTTGQATISSQLKILMSFFQIITHLADVLEVPWPSAYRYLVGIFDFVCSLITTYDCQFLIALTMRILIN
jgi:hypothetical protein